MTTIRCSVDPGRQQGMVLLSAVVFLLVLTLFGIWSAANNSLQERMAGNTRNRDLALQAAEAALEHAESTFASWRAGPFDGSVTGLLAYDPSTPNDMPHWRDAARWTSHRTVPTGNLNQVNAAPIYVIQRLPNSANPANPALFNVENYRITARAVGGDPDSVVILQSIVSFVPP